MGLFSSAVGGLIGGLFDTGSSALSSALSYKYAKKMADYNQRIGQQNLEYQLTKSPSFYRQGLESAGYNPMLAISDGMQMGAVTQGNAKSPDFDFSNVVSSAKQGAMFDAELDNLKASTEASRLNAKAATDQAAASAASASANSALSLAKARETMQKVAEADPSVGTRAANRLLNEAIQFEAMTGNGVTDAEVLRSADKGASSAYQSAVQAIRNRHELERYKNSREHAIMDDANNVFGTGVKLRSRRR